MSSQRTKRRRTVAEPEFFSQPATSTDPALTRQYQDDDLEEQIETYSRRAVGAMLNQKTLHPFSTSDIVSGMSVKRKMTAVVVQRAKMLLFEVYGLKLVEVGVGKYIVCLPRDAHCRRSIDDKGKEPMKTFLVMTLSFICFHKGILKQETLLSRYMPKFFPQMSDDSDEYFGNVNDLLKELKSSMYIREISIDNDAGLKIGPRSREEFDIKAVVSPVLERMLARIPADLKLYLDTLPA